MQSGRSELCGDCGGRNGNIVRKESIMKTLKISLLALLITAAASTVYADDGPEGRTPGYWKNHTLAWTDYSPDDSFSGVFGILSVQEEGLTLEDALNLNGGGINALSRHAVAALLNASDPDINYPASVDEITGIFTIVSLAADEDWLDDWIEETKDILDYWNNLGLE